MQTNKSTFLSAIGHSVLLSSITAHYSAIISTVSNTNYAAITVTIV
jgi:hypothetical protein